MSVNLSFFKGQHSVYLLITFTIQAYLITVGPQKDETLQ